MEPYHHGRRACRVVIVDIQTATLSDILVCRCLVGNVFYGLIVRLVGS